MATPAKPGSGRGRSWGKRVALGLLVLASVAALVLALSWSRLRQRAGEMALEMVSELLVGDFHVEHVESLSPWSVRLRGVRIDGPDGDPVVTVDELETAIVLSDLLELTVTLPRVRLRGATVSLRDLLGDELVIAETFLPVEDDAAPEDTSSVDVRVQVEDILVSDVRVKDLPEGYVLDLADVRGRVRYDPRGTRVEVAGAQLAVSRGSEPVAEGTLAGQLALIEGERSTAQLKLRAGESALSTKLQVGYGADGFELPSGELALAVEPSLPARLGLHDLPVQLRDGVRVEARFDGAAREAEVDLETSGGDLSARASQQGEGYLLQLTTDRLDLRPTLGPDAPPVLAGDLSLELSPREGEWHYGYDLSLKDGRVADVQLPTTRVMGDVEPGTLRVSAVQLPRWLRDGDQLSLSGRLTEGGRVRVDLRADLREPVLAGFLKRATGVEARRLHVEVHGSYDHGSAQIDARGTLRAEGLRAPGVEVEVLRADVRARGSLLKPRLETTLHVGNLQTPHATLVSVEAQLAGFENYKGTLAIEGEQTHTAGSVGIQLREDSASLQGRLVTRFEDGRQVRVTVGDLLVRGGGVDMKGVRLVGDNGQLTAEGTVAFRGRSDLSLALAGIDLDLVAKLPALEEYLGPWEPRGRLSGNLRLQGTFDAPSLVAELRGVDMGLRGARLGSLQVDLEYAADGDRVRLQAKVDPPMIDRLELTLTGDLPPGHRLDASLRRGRYQLVIDGLVSDVAAFASLHPALEEVKGGIDLRADVEGSEDEGVTGEVELTTVQASYRTLGPASLRAGLRLAPESMALSAALVDDAGDLALLEAELQASLIDLARGGVPDADWEVRAQVPRRRLDAFPDPLRVDLPVSLSASLEARGHRLSLSGLVLTADASWAGDPAPGAPAECFGLDRLATVKASLREGQLAMDGAYLVDGVSVLQVVASGALPDVPLDSLDPRDARVQVSLQTDRLDLATLPTLCGQLRGQLHADVEAVGLFAGKPDVTADVRIDGLGAHGGETLDVQLRATAVTEGASGELEARHAGRKVLSAKATLPWRWRGLEVPGELPAVPTGEVRLDRLPLAPLAEPFRKYVRLRGALSGRLATRPGQDHAVVVGKLSLHDVDLALSQPALRLEGLQGTVEVDERKLRFTDLRWGDREGRLRTSGEVELDGLKPVRAKIQVKAEDLPLRSDGLAFATIDTDLRVEAELAKRPAEVHIGIDQLTVELADELGHSSQGLDPHPDVIYVDSFDDDAASSGETTEAVEDVEPAFVARIYLETPKPFWVRHQDFAVQIQPKLQIVTRDEGARIAGPVYVRRGYVSLVGRTFNFERGEIRFAGSEEIDPTVDMVAKHFLGGGDFVQVRIGGYLSRPTLEFSTNVAGVGNNETEIMALLVRGKPGEGSASASAEAAAMLSGLTAGFLSSLTRGKYGEYVPVLALEAGSSTGTRLRAGVQMDDFVPKALRGVVQGAYVEGYVGTGGNDATGQQGGRGGFLIELYMPHDITTSGAYDEPANWSIDVLWEPLR